MPGFNIPWWEGLRQLSVRNVPAYLQVALQDAAGQMAFVANLLDSPKYADTTLLAIAPHCEGSAEGNAQHPFRCHRAILAARSPYFDAVFSSGALALLSGTIPHMQPVSGFRYRFTLVLGLMNLVKASATCLLPRNAGGS